MVARKKENHSVEVEIMLAGRAFVTAGFDAIDAAAALLTGCAFPTGWFMRIYADDPALRIVTAHPQLRDVPFAPLAEAIHGSFFRPLVAEAIKTTREDFEIYESEMGVADTPVRPMISSLLVVPAGKIAIHARNETGRAITANLFAQIYASIDSDAFKGRLWQLGLSVREQAPGIADVSLENEQFLEFTRQTLLLYARDSAELLKISSRLPHAIAADRRAWIALTAGGEIEPEPFRAEKNYARMALRRGIEIGSKPPSPSS